MPFATRPPLTIGFVRDAWPICVPVILTNKLMISAPVMATVKSHAPAFFPWGANKYALTTRYPDNKGTC